MRSIVPKLLKSIWRSSPSWGRELVCRLLALGLPQAQNLQPKSTDPIWIAGFFQEPTGLGQGARLFYKEMIDAGKNVYPLDLGKNYGLKNYFDKNLFYPKNYLHYHSAGSIIFHVNPPHFLFELYRCRRIIRNKRIIGLWNWELEKIPAFWKTCTKLVDEVICPSNFTANAIRQSFQKPVTVHPYHIPIPTTKTRQFISNDIVRILTIMDLGSNFYRKNPIATIKAFKLAFEDNRQVELILKIGSTSDNSKEWQLIKRAAGNSPNIRPLLKHLSPDELAELYQQSDIFISLHRAEGYGLTIREAMLYGLEVVATGWSGNMDFMKGPKCHPVRYHLVKVDDPSGGFLRESTVLWAEADIINTTTILKELSKKILQSRADSSMK